MECAVEGATLLVSVKLQRVERHRRSREGVVVGCNVPREVLSKMSLCGGAYFFLLSRPEWLLMLGYWVERSGEANALMFWVNCFAIFPVDVCTPRGCKLLRVRGFALCNRFCELPYLDGE